MDVSSFYLIHNWQKHNQKHLKKNNYILSCTVIHNLMAGLANQVTGQIFYLADII